MGETKLKTGDREITIKMLKKWEISRPNGRSGTSATCICKGESAPPVEKESTQEISVPKDSLVEELPDSLLSDEKQSTETKERRDEQLCYRDSLVEEPPDSFVSDNVPVVSRDGTTPSSEDSLVKEPPDTVVCVVQSCVVPPRVGVTPSRGIPSDLSQRVVPPRVGVTPSRRIPSDVSQRQRKTTDNWDSGPRVQRAVPVLGASRRGALPNSIPRTPWRVVQPTRTPWRGVQQQRAPTKGVQQRAPTKGVHPPRTPWRGVQPPGTLLRGVPSDPAVVEKCYHTRKMVVPRSCKTLG